MPNLSVPPLDRGSGDLGSFWVELDGGVRNAHLPGCVICLVVQLQMRSRWPNRGSFTAQSSGDAETASLSRSSHNKGTSRLAMEK